jgi:conjugal transfer/entry exclusion protein
MANLDIITRLRNEAKAGLKGLEGNLKDVESATKNTDKWVKNVSKELKTTLVAGAAVAGTALFALKKGFDFAKEGAQLERVEDQFGRLATSIGSDADTILAALDEATGGMMTTAEQMNAASQIISLGLADNETDVVRLATLVSELGWDMSQVILTFANDSKMRLDSLGLSVTDVEERTQKFIEAGHDVSKAFDLAVLEAGEEKLLLLGSAADSSVAPYKRLETLIEETTDTMKLHLSEGITPVVEALLNDYGPAVEQAGEDFGKQINLMSSTVEWNKLRGQLRDTGRSWLDIDKIVRGGRAGLDLWRDSADLTEDLDRNRVGIIRMNAAMDALNMGLVDGSEEFYAYIDAQAAAEIRAQGLNDAYGDLVEGTAAVADGTGDLTTINWEATRMMEDHWIRVMKEGQREMGEAAEVVEDLADEWDGLDDIVRQSVGAQTTAMSQLFTAYDDLEAAQGEYVTVYKSNSDEIAEIQSQLMSDLSDEQKEGLEDQLGELDEFSAEAIGIWNQLQGDLSESQRRELIAQLSDLQGAHGEMQSVYTGDAEAAEEAQQRIDAAMGAIGSSYQNMVLEIARAKLSEQFGEDTRSIELAMIDLQEAMGLVSESQAEAMRNMVVTTQNAGRELDRVFDAFLEDGRLTAEELAVIDELTRRYQNTATTMGATASAALAQIPPPIIAAKDAAQEFVDGGPYEAELDSNAEDVGSEIDILKGKTDSTAGTYNIHFSVTSDPFPQPEGGGATGGGAGNLPGPDAPDNEFQHGGFTGSGWGFAGRVHHDEFVFSPPAVQRLGVPMLEALHEAASTGSATGSLGSAGGDFIFSPTINLSIPAGAGSRSGTAEFERIAYRVLDKVAREAEARWRMR